MATWEQIHAGLNAPFDPKAVHWRVGSMTKDKKRGMALAYIDARDVMQRLDEVCGPPNWQTRHDPGEGRVICHLGIRAAEAGDFGDWVWKSDGAGDSDIEGAKGAISDALKRAAVSWGVGRYLYRCESPWVELDQYKRMVPGQEGKMLAALQKVHKYVPPQGEPAQPASAHSQQAPPAQPAPGPFPSDSPPPEPAAPGEYYFGAKDGRPEEPSWAGWKDDAIKSGKMKGRTWREICEGSFKGQRYQYAVSLATFEPDNPEKFEQIRLRALNAVWEIERGHRIATREEPF